MSTTLHICPECLGNPDIKAACKLCQGTGKLIMEHQETKGKAPKAVKKQLQAAILIKNGETLKFANFNGEWKQFPTFQEIANKAIWQGYDSVISLAVLKKEGRKVVGIAPTKKASKVCVVEVKYTKITRETDADLAIRGADGELLGYALKPTTFKKEVPAVKAVKAFFNNTLEVTEDLVKVLKSLK